MKNVIHSLLIIRKLLFAALTVAVLYLFWQNLPLVPYILNLRLMKLLTYLTVSCAGAFATISFQAVVQSHFLTPGVLGLESFYKLLQTLFVFFTSSLFVAAVPESLEFLVLLLLMMGIFGLLIRMMSFQRKFDVYTLLMVGLVLGTFFNSLSTFFQVLMDPNEYDQLQTRLFASFQTTDSWMLWWAVSLVSAAAWMIWKKRFILEVLQLGDEKANSLGVQVDKEKRALFSLIVLLTAVSAALVGPMTFLGFVTANMTYRLFPTYRMNILLPAGVLIGFLFVTLGQFLVEEIFLLQTNVSIVVEFAGGVLFFYSLWKERKTL